MNIDIFHRPIALENLLAGRIWPAGRRLPMHGLELGVMLEFGLGPSLLRKSRQIVADSYRETTSLQSTETSFLLAEKQECGSSNNTLFLKRQAMKLCTVFYGA